ncbi:MAG TPA: RNA polymerase sigma factor [Longimicrobiales bacterium]|nr:RNA polymerase sigma factor [Longimicrobiales bacterium]
MSDFVAMHPTRTGAAQASDPEDVALAAGGDTRAFERLYRRHGPRIHSLALRMLGPDLAEDVTQDVFIRAWEKLALFEGRSAFGTWLYRLAINVCLARRTKVGKRRARFLADETALARARSPGRGTGGSVDLERAIQRLPDRARQVFVLHDVEGYKHREVADLLAITTGTSKSQLHQARRMLREYLKA